MKLLFQSFSFFRAALVMCISFILACGISGCDTATLSPAVNRYCTLIDNTARTIEKDPERTNITLRKLNQQLSTFSDPVGKNLTDDDKKALIKSLQNLAHIVILEHADVSNLSRINIKAGLERVDNVMTEKVNNSTTLNELINSLN